MENILNIQLTVDDEQLAQLIRGNIEALPKDRLQDLLCSALSAFLETDDGRKLFYTKDSYYSNPKPTPLFTQMVSNAVSEDLLKPCVDEFMKVISENYVTIIKSAMVETFSNMFFTQMDKSMLAAQLNNLQNEINSKRG